MRFPARLFCVQKILFCALCILLVFFFFTVPFVSITYAQTTTDLNSYVVPNTDSNVPHNLHTYAQSVLIEVTSAVVCELVGVDPINPTQSCLGINPQSHKLGLAPNNSTQIGGVLGLSTNLITALYTPPASGLDYVRYMSSNFGLVKHVYAQNSGFDALRPLLNMWVSIRDVAYLALVVVFIIIGLAVMLRIKIDPRTVMTVQNQIPRVIIGILLITFSYAIAGAMVDAMWIATYAGINIMTQGQGMNVPIPHAGGGGCGTTPLSQLATQDLLTHPLGFFNDVFSEGCNFLTGGGVFSVSGDVAGSLGSIIGGIISNFFNSNPNAQCIGGFPPSVDPGACVADFFGFIVSRLVAVVSALIIFIILIVLLFRIWFALLKAYAMVLVYTVASPLYILLGLLPGKPLGGFQGWIRRMFANLAVFPATALLLVFARILETTVQPTGDNKWFIPPLTANPNISHFQALAVLGVLLVTPSLLDIIRNSIGAKTSQAVSAAIGAGIAGGAAPVAGASGLAWKRMTRPASYYHQAGILRGYTYDILAGRRGPKLPAKWQQRRELAVKGLLGQKERFGQPEPEKT